MSKIKGIRLNSFLYKQFHSAKSQETGISRQKTRPKYPVLCGTEVKLATKTTLNHAEVSCSEQRKTYEQINQPSTYLTDEGLQLGITSNMN